MGAAAPSLDEDAPAVPLVVLAVLSVRVVPPLVTTVCPPARVVVPVFVPLPGLPVGTVLLLPPMTEDSGTVEMPPLVTPELGTTSTEDAEGTAPELVVATVEPATDEPAGDEPAGDELATMSVVL